MTQLDDFKQRIAEYSGRKIFGRRFLRRSSVAVVLADVPQVDTPSVLLIRRASRSGDPWSGHMAFPGGRLAQSDASAQAAAVRELKEETGLDAGAQTVFIGRISDVVTRSHNHLRPMVVSPFLYHLIQEPDFKLNHEVNETVWVPLSFLADEENREHMQWHLFGRPVRLPCYRYGPYTIWGLTLLMLDELTALWQGRSKKGFWWFT